MRRKLFHAPTQNDVQLAAINNPANPTVIVTPQNNPPPAQPQQVRLNEFEHSDLEDSVILI